jgi:hypothetical protein
MIRMLKLRQLKQTVPRELLPIIMKREQYRMVKYQAANKNYTVPKALFGGSFF